LTDVFAVLLIEKLPECGTNLDEFVGPNNCSIPPDEIQLSCSVTYSGNKSPELKWRKFGDSGDLESTCTTEHADHRKICNLTIEPNLLLNGSIFVCRTTERASDEQYNCTTKPIVILRKYITAFILPAIRDWSPISSAIDFYMARFLCAID